MISLNISDLAHEFDQREVFGSVNFACDGGCVAIRGPNGSGKSTLMRILAGLLQPTSGEARILFDGNAVEREALSRVVGLTAPDVRLYPELSARENLRFLVHARGIFGWDDRVTQALVDVELAERADDPVGELSSGLRQRACIAAALVHNPGVLLLDEPSSNLDEDGVRMLRRIIDRQRERGMVVLASNDASEISLADARLDLGANR